MHRSGTSALAHVLNLLGCDLLKTLLDGNDSNETGHWESVPIMDLNNEILNSAGSGWHDWLPFNQGWYASPKAEEVQERLPHTHPRTPLVNSCQSLFGKPACLQAFHMLPQLPHCAVVVGDVPVGAGLHDSALHYSQHQLGQRLGIRRLT